MTAKRAPDCVTCSAPDLRADPQSAAFWNGDQMVGWSEETVALALWDRCGVSGWLVVHWTSAVHPVD